MAKNNFVEEITFKNKWVSNIYYYITTLPLFNIFRNSQHPEKWSVSFKNFFGNVNTSVVTCRYPQIYNFSFGKEFSETICKCIYLGFLPQVLQHLLWRTVSLAVCPCSILVNNT